MSRTRPKHAPRVPFALLVSGIVVGGLCLFLVLNTASAANELDRHDLAGKDAAISAQLEQLRNEVAASAAPDALARAAVRLGMVPAGDPAFLVIGADGKVRVLGSAAAAKAPVTSHPHTKSTSTSAATSTAESTATSTATSTGTSTSASTSTSRSATATHTTTATKTPTAPGGGAR